MSTAKSIYLNHLWARILFVLLAAHGADACQHDRSQRTQEVRRTNERRASKVHALIGKSVALNGEAMNSKAGAVLVTDEDDTIYIEGLDYWPNDMIGKEVVVTGELRRKKLIPDPVVTDSGAISQGAEGEQLVLENAEWKLRNPV